MSPEEPAPRPAPKSVLDVDANEIHAGDRIAYAVDVYKTAVLRTGVVEEIYYASGYYKRLMLKVTMDDGGGSSRIRAGGAKYIKL